MRPLSEQTILITGATDGLGRALARDLAERGATVLVHGRSRERIERTVNELRGENRSAPVSSYQADFCSLDEVRRLAAVVARDHPRLDRLVNNAGAGPGKRGELREASADGHELRLAVNYLAPFLLSWLLLPALQRSMEARIVNVASAGQEPIDFSDPMMTASYDGMRAYRRSKLALISHSFELAARLRDRTSRVTVNAVHPATLMDTKMVREHFGYAETTIQEGLEAARRQIISPELEGMSGRYFDGLSEARAHDQAYDPEARGRLWRLGERLTGLAPDQPVGAATEAG